MKKMMLTAAMICLGSGVGFTADMTPLQRTLLATHSSIEQAQRHILTNLLAVYKGSGGSQDKETRQHSLSSAAAALEQAIKDAKKIGKEKKLDEFARKYLATQVLMADYLVQSLVFLEPAQSAELGPKTKQLSSLLRQATNK